MYLGILLAKAFLQLQKPPHLQNGTVGQAYPSPLSKPTRERKYLTPSTMWKKKTTVNIKCMNGSIKVMHTGDYSLFKGSSRMIKIA